MKKRIAIVVGEFPTINETFIINQITSLIDLGYDINILSYERTNISIIHKNIKKYDLLNKTFYALQKSENKLIRFFVFFKYLILNTRKINWRLFFKTIFNNLFNKHLYSLHLFYNYSAFLIPENREIIEKSDIIIVHFGVNAISLADLKKMGLFKDKKVIVHFHGFDMQIDEIDLNKIRYKSVFEESDLLAVNTSYLEGILKKLNLNHNNIVTLPVGLKFPLEYSKDIHKFNRFTIVFCGRLIQLKGPDNVIEIADIVVNKMKLEVDFMIVGEGEMFDEIKSLIESKNLSKNVELKGSLTQENLFEIYQRSHIFLLPGIYDSVTKRAEAQGLVIQEAQYFQLPVLVSDAGGMKYGMINGETGYVIEQKNHKAFAEKIRFLYDNESLRLRMGAKGKKFVIEKFDFNIINGKLLSLLEK